MDAALLAARILLAIVFGAAALTKLADRPRTRTMLIGFGTPARLARALALLLPVIELAVAVLVLPIRTAWAATCAALVLLAIFSAAIGYNLVRGRRPDCHCFGQIGAGPVSWRTLIRNGLLMLPAGFVIWQGRDRAGASAVAWLGDLSTAERVSTSAAIAGLVLAGAVLWLLLQLIAQNGRLLTRLDEFEARLVAAPALGAVADPAPTATVGLSVGTPAPAFALAGLYGETLTLDALRAAGKPVLLTFMDPGCGPCNALLPDVGRWQRQLGVDVTMAVISRGTAEENRAKSAEHGLAHVLLQQDREVAATYQAWGTPGAVLIRADGTIGSPLAQGAEEIRALVARAMTGADIIPVLPRPAVAPALPDGDDGPCPHCGQYHANTNGNGAAPAMTALKVGDPAPPLALPDLDGKPIALADYRGRETLVLFWNPGCGFCQQMLPDLKAWEANHPANAPALLIVSTGTKEANEAQGLASTMVLEPSFSAGYGFGVNGTPSGVLVDREGKIASEVAVGAQAVLALSSSR